MSPRPGGDVSNSAEYAVIGSTPVETEGLKPEQVEAAAAQQRLREVGKSVAGRLIREHPTLVLTLVYLALTLVGMMHDFWFYLYFKINILVFSETSDFLLAALRNPLVILISIVPVFLWVGLQQTRRAAMKRSTWYRNYAQRYENTRWNSLSSRAAAAAVFILVYASALTQVYALQEANRIRDGKGKRVTFLRNDGIVSDEQPILLGTTGKFLFLYFPSRKATEIVPVENTVALTVDSRRRKDRQRDSLATAFDSTKD